MTMTGWLTFSAIWISTIIAEFECGYSLNCDSYDAVYDFENRVMKDYSPSITKWESETGSGCSTQMVLKLTFSGNRGNNTRLLIDFFLNSPSQWTFNLGDSETNNGFVGDSLSQFWDAELQLLGGTLTGYRSDVGGSGEAFSLKAPSTFTRVTLLVSDFMTIWSFNGDPSTVNFYRNTTSWFALNNQPDGGGPVNNDLYLGINRVVVYNARYGTGVCKVGLKWMPTY